MRRCIGASFAVLEMSTILRRVARALRLEAAGDGPELITRRAIIFAPSRGGEVIASRASGGQVAQDVEPVLQADRP
jgi:cytochrome P450 family 135